MTKAYPYILAIISSALFTAGLPGYNIFPLSLLSLIPLFTALNGKTFKQSLAIALVFGTAVGLMYYGWVIQSSAQYASELSGKELGMYTALSCYNAFWYGMVGGGYYYLLKKKRFPLWKQVVGTSSLWVSIEWLYQNSFSSFPWIIILPYTQWNNLYLLQWLSLGGMWLVSFIVVSFNALMVSFLEKRKYNLALITLAVFLCVHVAGYFMYNDAQEESRASVNVALIQENINAEARWDDKFVDSLAHILLDLNRQAATMSPNLIVWSETAIPWTFQTDDDLVNEVLKITYPTGASHLIGMLTEADKNGNVYNSIYYIEPDGKISARYDKQELLAFLEKPVIARQLPFRQSRYENILEGKRTNIIPTKYAVFGAMICNETLSPLLAARAVREGAQALIASSNDSWFYGTVLTDAHLALTRMRAIETRKDISVNANRGYCGVIRASGRMETLPPSEFPRGTSVNVHLNNEKPPATQYPNIIAYAAFVVVILYGIQAVRAKS